MSRRQAMVGGWGRFQSGGPCVGPGPGVGGLAYLEVGIPEMLFKC
jgi:hypothetical protein